MTSLLQPCVATPPTDVKPSPRSTRRKFSAFAGNTQQPELLCNRASHGPCVPCMIDSWLSEAKMSLSEIRWSLIPSGVKLCSLNTERTGKSMLCMSLAKEHQCSRTNERMNESSPSSRVRGCQNLKTQHKYAISELPFASVSNRVLVHNLCYGN